MLHAACADVTTTHYTPSARQQAGHGLNMTVAAQVCSHTQKALAILVQHSRLGGRVSWRFHKCNCAGAGREGAEMHTFILLQLEHILAS